MRDSSSRHLAAPRIRAVLATVAAAGALVVVEFVNRVHGDLLGQYFEEYQGGGSFKWRGEIGDRFQTVLLITLAVAVVAFGIAAPTALRWYRSSTRAPQRAAAVACMAVATGVLMRFFMLRVPAAAFELGP